MDTLVDDEDRNVRKNLAGNPSLHKEHMDTLVDDEDKWVRWNLAMNTSLHKEHIDKLANDKDELVLNKIKNHPNYKSP